MKFEKTMDQAKKLIGERRFADGFKVCETLIQLHTEEAEASILAAACLMCQGCPQKDEKKIEKVRKAAARAFAAAESAEAVCSAEKRLLSAMSRYRGERMEASLKKQKEKPSLPELKAYFDTGLSYEPLPQLVREEAQKALTEKFGTPPGESMEESPEDTLNQQLSAEEFELSRSIFGETRALVQFRGTGTGKAVGDTLRQAIEMLTVAQILAARCTMVQLDEETRLTRLESEAEILQYCLSSTVHPDGEMLSLFCSGREEMIAKLRELYPQITALNPLFQPPELPLAAPVNTVPQKPAKSGFFGKPRKK